jgi:hypothetical protein
MDETKCDICWGKIIGSYRWQYINGTVYRWHFDCEEIVDVNIGPVGVSLSTPPNIILGEE